jgi:hypothetical protein
MIIFLDPADPSVCVDYLRTPVCIGDTVLLRHPHQYAGQRGVYVGMVTRQRMVCASVRLDDGAEARVWSNIQWARISDPKRGEGRGA